MTSTGPPALMSHQSFQSTYSSYSHSSARDTQSSFGIKPFTAMLGAVKVGDMVEIALTAALTPR